MSAFICDKSTILGNCTIGNDTIVLHSTLHGEDDGEPVVLGERNVIEVKCYIKNSTILHSNTLCVGVRITNSTIGGFNTIGSGCKIENCQIGDLCVLAAGIELKNAIIPSNTLIVLDSITGWRCESSSSDLIKSIYDANQLYWKLLASKESAQYVGKHFKLR